MPKIQYKEIRFRQSSLDLIRLVNEVINDYKAQGYELTLRQVYYQLVARGYIPNNERSYKNIGNLMLRAGFTRLNKKGADGKSAFARHWRQYV